VLFRAGSTRNQVLTPAFGRLGLAAAQLTCSAMVPRDALAERAQPST
jgi:hypothetical protein